MLLRRTPPRRRRKLPRCQNRAWVVTGRMRRPSRISFISRNSLLIDSRLPAAAAARTSSLNPSGNVTHSVRVAEHPPSVAGVTTNSS